MELFGNDYKIISDLMPRYDGNPKRLNFYIREVDNLLTITEPLKGPAAQAIVCLIKSRLSGAAIDAIVHEGALNSWNDIKQALVQRLGEPRNEIQVMQELTRTRRNRNEDAESYGKRIRELLDTLYMVGQHADKSYYEKMAIEQYVNHLDFQVAIGVRILKPNTLELAIVTARQEETKTAGRQTSNYSSQQAPQNKVKNDFKPNNAFPRQMVSQPFNNAFNFTPPQQFVPQNSYTPRPNNMTPEQRQQVVNAMLPWKNRPQGSGRNNSGNFRNNNYQRQPNVPNQQVNPQHGSTDVTMRSVNRPPPPPQFAFEELFYTPNEGNMGQPQYYYDPMDPAQDVSNMYYQQASYHPWDAEETQASTTQDFPEDQDADDQS